MSFVDRLTSIIAPFDCLSCGKEGPLLCSTCTQLFPEVPERCYRCRKVSACGRTCVACRKVSRLYIVRVATDYEGIAQQLVWRLKFSGAVSAAEIMVQALLPVFEAPPNTLIVHVPTATRRVRQRGYDQAKILAKLLSRRIKMRYIDCLQRLGQTHQVGATRAERLKQLRGAFRVRRSQLIVGTHIILVDDVLTTGATLEAAAQALRAAGARRVDALVFAQT